MGAHTTPTPLRRMSAHEFVRRMKEATREPDRHYTLWIGAGCSVSSGIPAAAGLVRDDWLPHLHRLRDQDGLSIEEWARTAFEAYDPDNLAALYGPLMDELFHLPDERQRETERLCDGRLPGFGYAILAALMSRDDGIFSAALTTNFDDLIADAMYVFGERRPLVVQHAALANFVRPGRVQRPVVVKVHGDHRLNPMHTEGETAALKDGIRKGIHGLLHDRGVVFIGYSGNDRGVVAALEGLPDSALPLGVWWVSSRQPSSRIQKWLQARDATWVQVTGFDDLMLLFREEFEIEHPTAAKFEEMVQGYHDTYERLSSRIDELPDSAVDSGPLKEAARKARETASGWWGVELSAAQFKKDDPERADEIYREGVAKLNDARLLANYALFLTNNRKEHDRAEELFERAIDAEPKTAGTFAGFALFLTDVRHHYDRAEELFERAIEREPEQSGALGSYALFLKNVRKNYDGAERLFERAIDANPREAINLVNYAKFRAYVRKDNERGEELFERAISVAPENAYALGCYASFLTGIRRQHERAEELFERALAIEPDHTGVLGGYADFLKQVRKDYDRAEELYERALAIEPENSSILGNYANLLRTIRKDFDRAEELYERALSATQATAAEPEKAGVLSSYALFLAEARKDYDRAEELHERAIAADPERSMLLDNYALFLTSARKDDVRAEEFYERAIAIEPENTNALGNYARLLLEQKRDPAAWPLIDRAFVDPENDSLLAELWFYSLAAGDEQRAKRALPELFGLVEAGVRSPGWDFDGILERARERAHPDMDWLEVLADVISEKKSADALEGWAKWKAD